jgi:hypothetical protein
MLDNRHNHLHLNRPRIRPAGQPRSVAAQRAHAVHVMRMESLADVVAPVAGARDGLAVNVYAQLVSRFAHAWREAMMSMLRRVGVALAAVAGGLLSIAQVRAQTPADDVVWYKPMPGIVPAPATVFGLYDGADYRLAPGTCTDCPTPQQALWYFRDDLIAAPNDGVPVAGFTPGLAPQEDVRRWYAAAMAQELRARPQMLWMGASHVARDVTLTRDNTLKFPDGRGVDFKVVPKIKTNLSYYDDSSKAYFQQHKLKVRGELRGNIFTARSIWPQDWAIDETKLTLAPPLADESLLSMVRRHENARNETFEARLLWERTSPATPAARDWSGRAVIGIMLNGAQGDDDEAHGGHFAIVTGRHAVPAKQGAIAGVQGARGDMSFPRKFVFQEMGYNAPENWKETGS